MACVFLCSGVASCSALVLYSFASQYPLQFALQQLVANEKVEQTNHHHPSPLTVLFSVLEFAMRRPNMLEYQKSITMHTCVTFHRSNY